ncbi:MAG TPA: secretin N-terminal domain-containing protein, partial [Candidatus Babeliales bacterium]|nr:secretin N-terminal domain-containing protein [Candidatus Babeliales bacterium]
PRSKLPNNDTPIRYLYYFKNLTLAADPEAQRELTSILSNVLPPTSTEKAAGDTGSYGAGYGAASPTLGDPGIQFDTLTNSLLLTNRASCIRQALEIVHHLDDAGFKETVLMLSLQYTDANRIEKMLEELIKEQGDEGASYGYRPATAKKISNPKYLQNVKAIAVERTNSVILMGDAAAVLKLKNLIIDNLDQPVSSGKSIIHIKRLQYLDAKVFAQTLQNIVRGRRQQAGATGTPAAHDTMKDVIIMAEETGPVQKHDPTAQQDAKMIASFQEAASSGNNLIVAAHAHDWKELERIIEEMDQPQFQVSLEIIIADLALTDAEILGAQARGLHRDNLPPEVSWQSAQTSSPILNYVGAAKDNKIDMTK